MATEDVQCSETDLCMDLNLCKDLNEFRNNQMARGILIISWLGDSDNQLARGIPITSWLGDSIKKYPGPGGRAPAGGCGRLNPHEQGGLEGRSPPDMKSFRILLNPKFSRNLQYTKSNISQAKNYRIVAGIYKSVSEYCASSGTKKRSPFLKLF